MKFRPIVAFVFAVTAIYGQSYAQTVTAGAGGDFATLSLAIASFQTGGSNESNPAPNVINCLDAAYDELFPTINVQLTINGKAGRSTLLGQVNAGNDAFSLDPAAGAEIVLNDLIFIPSGTGTFTDDLVDIIGAAGSKVTFNQCVVSSNFSGGPLSLDGLTPPTVAPTNQVGDNGLNIAAAGSMATVDFNETVVTRACGPVTAGTPDNMLLSGAGKNVVNINAGCVFSYGQYRQIQVNNVDDLFINGTAADPVLFLGADGSHIGAFAVGAPTGALVVNHAILANGVASAPHATDPGGLYFTIGDRPTTVTNTLIINNSGPAFYMTAAYSSNMVVKNTTIAYNSLGSGPNETAQVVIGAAPTGSISFSDVIIAGGKTGISLAGGTVNVSDSALVLLGPDALLQQTSGAGTVNLNNVTNLNPSFQETSDLASADLFDVHAGTYAGLGSGGSNLSGGADFIGDVVFTAARNWTLWE